MSKKFHLGDWLVDEDANLLQGPDGEIRLEKRVMSVLAELAAANGAVVSKDALIEAVWNGAIISDHSVANAISDLRRALGDDTRNPRFIETIPKRGYRLLAAPEPIKSAGAAAADPTGASAQGRSWLQPAFIAVSILAIAVIIMLRFSAPSPSPRLFLTDVENATGDETLNIAAASAAEMLTVVLAGGDYRLVRWRDRDFSGAAIEADDRILAGRMVVDGGAPILSMQLVDGGDQTTLWAASYPADATRFATMAQSIVADLRTPLKLGDQPVATLGAADPAVFEQYWRARYLWSLREHGAIRDALRLLTDITQKAPNFAPAHAALADIFAHKTAEELGLPRQDTFARAETHVARALALNPNSSDAFVSQAYLAFFRDDDFERAFSTIEKAIAMRPENAVAWQTKAMIASAAGEASVSLEAAAHARMLDPLSASLLWDEVWFLYIAGDFEAALEASARARRVSAPVTVYEALIHLARGDEEAAFQSWIARAQTRGLGAAQIGAIRQIARADGAAAGLAALADSQYAEHRAPRAALLSWLGRQDEAVLELRAYENAEKSWWLNWFSVMPAFETIRRDPRLSDYLRPSVKPSG